MVTPTLEGVVTQAQLPTRPWRLPLAGSSGRGRCVDLDLVCAHVSMRAHARAAAV